VKALLVLAGEPFRHTHDLDYLVARAVPFHPDLGDILEQFRPLSIWSVAFRCPAIDDATSDQDLWAPPSNHFEKLRGNLDGFHSIRVNRQWRLIFLWDGGRGEATGLYLDDHSYL
jgi:proteic killer suppression protein